jgi:hypothetical protein
MEKDLGISDFGTSMARSKGYHHFTQISDASLRARRLSVFLASYKAFKKHCKHLGKLLIVWSFVTCQENAETPSTPRRRDLSEVMITF